MKATTTCYIVDMGRAKIVSFEAQRIGNGKSNFHAGVQIGKSTNKWIKLTSRFGAKGKYNKVSYALLIRPFENVCEKEDLFD